MLRISLKDRMPNVPIRVLTKVKYVAETVAKIKGKLKWSFPGTLLDIPMKAGLTLF